MAERQIRNRKGLNLPTVIEEASEEHAEYYCSDASDSDTEVPVIICCERCCRRRARSKMPVQGCEKCKLASEFIHSVCTQREREHIEAKKRHCFDVWGSILPRRVKAVQVYYALTENVDAKNIWRLD
jgi:hypothetical protein